ncbi:hypothetical protein [Niabella aquatica]
MDIIAIIMNAAALAYMLFLQSYVKEKGKNMATKQDIEVITTKVEAVKYEFSSKSKFVLKQREVYEKILSSMAALNTGSKVTIEENAKFKQAYFVAWAWLDDESLSLLNNFLNTFLRISTLSVTDPTFQTEKDTLNEMFKTVFAVFRKKIYPDTTVSHSEFVSFNLI